MMVTRFPMDRPGRRRKRKRKKKRKGCGGGTSAEVDISQVGSGLP